MQHRTRLAILASTALFAGALATSGGATAQSSGPNGRLTYAVGNGAFFEVGVTGLGVINPGENSRAPDWSPTSEEIVYNTVAGLVIRSADGSNSTLLPQGTEPDWSPDGSQIVFRENLIQPLSIIDRDGTPSGIDLPFGGNPAWSPDGNRIAFDRGGELWTFDLDTDVESPIVQDGMDNRWPEWSPDGQRLAYTRIDRSSPTGATGLIVIVDATTGATVTEFPAPGPNAFDVVPSWSPDGELIAVERQFDGGGTGVYTLRVDRPSDPAVVVVDDPALQEGHPSWEPIDEPSGPTCTIIGTESADVLVGTPGDDVICALGGRDVVFGSGGDDTLLGGDGRDVLIGGGGEDRIEGGAGRDLLVGGRGDDVLDGGPARDRCVGGAGNDSLVSC